MSKLTELAHWLWLETQLGAPPFVQRTVLPLLHRTKEIARFLAQPYMPLYELKGQNQAGPITVTYGGLGYIKPILKNMLFSEEPVEQEIDRVFVGRPGELTLSTASDLTIIEASRHLIDKLAHENAIILPFRVKFLLSLQGEWPDVEHRFRYNTRRKVRKAQRYKNYEYEISYCEEDAKAFYHTMYLPTIRGRHGKMAAILPEREAYQLLRHGGLFLVKRGGINVCGVLVQAQQGTFEIVEMGVLDGNVELLKEHVVDAMTFLCICWAHQQGYESFSFGATWPYLSGGTFQAKRRWGTTIKVSPHEHKRIWIRVQHNTPAVNQFLKDNPCLTIDDSGKLQGLIVTDDSNSINSETEAQWRKLYATPGLNGLRVCSVADLRYSKQTSTIILDEI